MYSVPEGAGSLFKDKNVQDKLLAEMLAVSLMDNTLLLPFKNIKRIETFDPVTQLPPIFDEGVLTHPLAEYTLPVVEENS